MIRKIHIIFLLILFLSLSCKKNATDAGLVQQNDNSEDKTLLDNDFSEESFENEDLSEIDNCDADNSIDDADSSDGDVPDNDNKEPEDMSHCKTGEIRITACSSDESDLQKQICDDSYKWVDQGACFAKYEIGKMVSIPAGAFLMGCDKGKVKCCKSDELPIQQVYIEEYSIDVYEVTADQFKKCVDAGICKEDQFLTNSDDRSCALNAEGKEDHPMNCISWKGAESYCAWAGKRLPTEAEWEKASRGKYGRLYPWGDERASCVYSVMNHRGSGCNEYDPDEIATWKVGLKTAGVSPYGLFDMSGNVWEWVSDRYSPENTPDDPDSYPVGYETRVVRGGAFDTISPMVLFTFRRSYSVPEGRRKYVGFRCAQ